MRVVGLVGILIAVITVAVGIWQVAETPGSFFQEEAPTMTPAPTPGATVLITIVEGESVQDIGEKLEDEDIISSALLFRVMVALEGYEETLKAGDYEFEKGMATVAVVERLRQGITAPLVVTIREGVRAEEIADLMEDEGVMSGEQFLEAINGSYDFIVLRSKPDGQDLNGYLFPETYFFGRAQTPEEIVRQILATFEERFNEELRQEAANLGLSVYSVLKIASIVEREAVVPEERPIIASVFLRRLRLGIPLEADPTVQYALANDPVNVGRYGYWKQNLTTQDLEIDSPYNTYRIVGLPPGPIANPGLDSILAVIRPEQTNYLYFVAKPDGSHAFAETLEEHLQNIQEYRGQ
jgi:UPF0755 protein